MLRLLRLLPFLLLAPVVSAQTTYSYTIPGQLTAVNSYEEFTFPATPLTMGNGTLELQWAACHQPSFGGSSITVQIMLSTGWTTIYSNSSNYLECIFVPVSILISQAQMADAIATSGGSILCRVDCNDSCQAGVGCATMSDPVVAGITLTYPAHAANFSASQVSFCPGGTVQYTDASIGSPSSYAWYFEGGVPTTSTDPNPLVQYPNAGTWDVVLSVVTDDGPDELILSNYITVNPLPQANAGADEDACIGQSQQLQASGGTSYQWSPATGLSNTMIANPTANVTGTITYTVLVTDANGCQASDSMVLTMHDVPVVSASAGNNTLCPGDTATIVAVGAQSYTWSPNLFISSNTGASIEAWPPSDFTWTIFGTDAFGCAHDTTVTIDVLPSPPAPTATNTGMTVSSTPANGYQWYVDGDLIPGATQQEWSPLVNGNYSVMITDANGCHSQSLPVYFGTVGLTDAAAEGLRIFPQPADESISITGIAAGTDVRLIDASGRIAIAQRSSASGTLTMDVRALAPGSYVLEVGSAHATKRIAVVIE